MKHLKTYEFYTTTSHDAEYIYNKTDDKNNNTQYSEVVEELKNFIIEFKNNINVIDWDNEVTSVIYITPTEGILKISLCKEEEWARNDSYYIEINKGNRNQKDINNIYNISKEEYKHLIIFLEELEDDLKREGQSDNKEKMLNTFNPLRRSTSKYNL